MSLDRPQTRLARRSPSISMPRVYPPSWASAWGCGAISPFPWAVLHLGSDVRMRMRWIPPGRFKRGSHLVTLTSGFWLGEAPCTQGEWSAVRGNRPSRFYGDDRPVEQVSWDDCREFCSELCRRYPRLAARLPTEAEWEYACRAGTSTDYNDGVPLPNEATIAKVAWFFRPGEKGETRPVGKLMPNQWGLFDMHGNVWEWCLDWQGEYSFDDLVDPHGPEQGHRRIVRGGSWGYPAHACSSSYRSDAIQDFRFNLVGFRVAAGCAEDNDP
jgi:sulfatase modifying factor 1